MGEIVNLAANEAEQWGRHITWIKVNVGYIFSEAEYIQEGGQNVDDILQFLEAFRSYYSIFTDSEIALYRAARLNESDISKSDPERYVDPIRNMKGCFIPWLQSLDNIVQDRKKGENDMALIAIEYPGFLLVRIGQLHPELPWHSNAPHVDAVALAPQGDESPLLDGTVQLADVLLAAV